VAYIGMKWFRQHIKTGSRLALVALAIQFALSFGHCHALAAPSLQSVLSQADLAQIVAAPDAMNQTAQKPQPANPDSDRHPADSCAICAVIALAGNVLLATPPALQLPQAIEFLKPTTGAEFAGLNPARPAFHSRAPPAC
jgi:hypothetical protein